MYYWKSRKSYGRFVVKAVLGSCYFSLKLRAMLSV